MRVLNPIGHVTARGWSASGPVLVLTGTLAVTLIISALLQPSLARDALLPVTVTMMFGFAAGIAALAWFRPLPQRRFTYWDAAGVLTFIGICAAAAVEPEQAVQFVTGVERQR